MSQANEGAVEDVNPEKRALTWKDRGNHHYSKKEYEDATTAYRRGIDALESLDSPLALALKANLVMVLLKLTYFEEAATTCSWILAREPQNIKALYRRALAKEGISLDTHKSLSTEEIGKNFIEAIDDLKRCFSVLNEKTSVGEVKQKEACQTALLRLQKFHESSSFVNETHGHTNRKGSDIRNGGDSCQRNAAEQKQDVMRLFMARKVNKVQPTGEAFFLVQWKWWRDWCGYVDFFYLCNEKEEESTDRTQHVLQLLPLGAVLPRAEDDDYESSDDDSSCDSKIFLRPQPIDNSSLFIADSTFHRQWFSSPAEQHLRPNLVRGYDFEVIPREVYNALRIWYGEIKPSICRRTTTNGTINLYPPSQQDPLRSQSLTICSACKAPRATSKCGNCKVVSYCNEECQQAHWPFHRGSCKSVESNTIQRTREGGLVGLNNLGNTCFMNSALQCLSHAAPLTRHFLSNRFKKDINKNNPLGSGGKLALAYDIVMKDLWMKNKTRAISPTSIKRAIALFAPRFAGSLQHDAQEFLAYLLDGLHEDLNRIQSAPYVEMPDAKDGQNMAIAGARAWDAHKRRNDSLVCDNFYGQFQSTCVCPNCGKVSVSFDAFNHVALEIPHMENITATIPVLFFCLNGGRRPLRYAVTVNRCGSVSDLRLNLAELTGVSLGNLTLADIYNHSIYELLHDNKAIQTIGSNDVIAAFEVEPFTSRSIHAVTIHTTRSLDEKGEQKKKLIGFPLMISFDANLSCKQIWQRFWTTLCHYVHEENGDGCQSEDVLQIHVIDGRSKAPIEVFPTDDGKNTSVLPIHSSCPLSTFLGENCKEDFLFLSLEWENRQSQNGAPVIKIENFNSYDEHESIQHVIRSQHNNRCGNNSVSLDQCFRTFTNPERLDERNMWYCSRCKDHVKALKTMKLWRLPNILIVHLKRFAFKHTLRREKLDTLVDFPIDGLNMHPHCPKGSSRGEQSSFIEENVPAEYDLFGVINHYGRLGFGHYTAFARQWDESFMSDTFASFDDSSVTKVGRRKDDIVSSAAYVLFYRRRSFH